MIYKTAPVFIDGYGFDDSPLEVGPIGWCLLTIARLWIAFAFLFAAIVGIALIALFSPLLFSILGCDVLVDRLLPSHQESNIISH